MLEGKASSDRHLIMIGEYRGPRRLVRRAEFELNIYQMMNICIGGI
jgi:hypothetical protein